MLRHLHLAVLFAFMALTFAIDLPAGFLRPRQISPVISGVSSSETVPTTTTTAPTTQQPPTTTTIPTSASPSPSPTTSAAPPSTTVVPPTTTTVIPPSSSAAPPPSTSSIPPSSSSIPPSSTITSIPSNTISSAISDVTVTSTNLAPLDNVLTTITFTSDGRLVSSIATGTRTTVPTSTSKPGLASGYGNETNTLSAESKKLIGGIVGGIGGAFLLAGVGFVVYKMWGRKRHQRVSQEEDYFGGVAGAGLSAGSSDSLGKEKKSGWGPSSLTSKFSEPLDRYRSPNQATSPVAGSWGGRSPNAASNF